MPPAGMPQWPSCSGSHEWYDAAEKIHFILPNLAGKSGAQSVSMGSTVQPQAAATPNLAVLATAESEAPAPRISQIWHLVVFSPFAVLVWFVVHFGVNVPIADDWPFAYFFHAIRFKTATFDDFFALANEHRLFFPKLIWTPLAFATHWNLKAELVLDLVLALIIFAVFYRIALRQAQFTGGSLLNAANFATSLFLFSLVQYETWLLGVMGAVLLVHALLALAIAVCFLERLHPWWRFVLAAVFCFVASFSMLQGLASWLAMVPCIFRLQRGERKFRKLYIWLLLFAASFALYSYHFKFTAWAGDTSSDFLGHPLRSAGFFLALLGAPFSWSDAAIPASTACLLGGIILLSFLGCLLMLRGYARNDVIAPWLSVGLFGLLYAAMVTVGRGSFGLGVALSLSRYISGTIFVLIAAVQLGRVACARRGAQAYLFFVGALCALVTFSSIRAVSIGRQLKDERSHAKLFLELIRYIDPATDRFKEGCLFPLFGPEGYTGWIRMPAESLNELDFFHLASGITFAAPASPDSGSFDSMDGSGDVLHLRRKDEVTVSGWALRPATRGTAKVVLISYGDQKTFIAATVVTGGGRGSPAASQRDP